MQLFFAERQPTHRPLPQGIQCHQRQDQEGERYKHVVIVLPEQSASIIGKGTAFDDEHLIKVTARGHKVDNVALIIQHQGMKADKTLVNVSQLLELMVIDGYSTAAAK